jgi:hypothetical protein
VKEADGALRDGLETGEMAGDGALTGGGHESAAAARLWRRSWAVLRAAGRTAAVKTAGYY